MKIPADIQHNIWQKYKIRKTFLKNRINQNCCGVANTGVFIIPFYCDVLRMFGTKFTNNNGTQLP